MGKQNIKYTKEFLEPLVKISNSYKGLCKNIGIGINNGSRIMLKRYIDEYLIDISHFNLRKRRSLNKNIFTIDSDVDRSSIRYNIIKNNLIEYKCHSCGCNDIWLGQKMPLILDHINGINNDNRLENLRFLCSNCDSIQPTYKNRNSNEEKEKSKIRKQNIINSNKIRKQNIKKINIENKIKLLKNIDLNNKSWRVEVSKVLNCTPQYAGKFIKKYLK